MKSFVEILYLSFCLLLSGIGTYLALVSCFFFLKKPSLPKINKHLRFAVLIPARNEAACITGIIESINQQDYPPNLVDTYVIPNHCTDNTKQIARAAGARIISVSPSVSSKGQALHQAFETLLNNQNYDAFCVFDADNEADPHFLSEMNQALISGVRAAKSRIFAKNYMDSWVCACYEIFFCNANHFLNRPRHSLGLSARLIGTGFALRRDLLEELGGWNTTTLTEDAEFYALLSARGEKISFIPGAITYDEEPLTLRQSLIQRRRWVSGILEVGLLKAPALLSAAIRGKKKILAFDAIIQFAFTWFQAWIIPLFLLWAAVSPAQAFSSLPNAAICFYAGAFLSGGLALLLEKRLNQFTGRTLFLYPFFLFSFLPLQSLALFLPVKKWVPIHHTGTKLKSNTTLSAPQNIL